jgi:P4 family phage/plasmid primase-like protien
MSIKSKPNKFKTNTKKVKSIKKDLTIKEQIRSLTLEIATLGTSKKDKLAKINLKFQIEDFKNLEKEQEQKVKELEKEQEQKAKQLDKEQEQKAKQELSEQFTIEKKFELRKKENSKNLYKEKIDSYKSFSKDVSKLKLNVCELLLDNNPNTKFDSYLEAEELLVKHLISKYHIKSIKQDEKEEIWGYKKGIYVPYGKSLCKEELRVLLGKAYHKKFFNSIFEKIIAETFILPKEFYDINYEYLLPVQNGILNIKTKCLEPFDPELIFFSKLPINYNLKSVCPNIEKHLKSVLKNENDIILFQETMGNCLVKNYKLQKAVMMIGKGRNGKGVTLELINQLLGIENCASLSLQTLETDKFELSNLHGKLANTSGDLSSGMLSETGPFKNLTGGDLITAQRKFMTPIYFRNHAKLFFACNELPESKDETDGFFDRWIIFSFPFKFVPKSEFEKSKNENIKLIDTEIKDKLFSSSELEGFLNFALEGFHRINDNGYFSTSQTTDEIKETWTNNSNSALAFVNKMLYKGVTCEIKTSIVLDVYHDYCETNKLKPLSQSHLTRLLYNKYGSIKKQKRDGEDKPYYYTNISFNKSSNENLK